MTMLRSKATSRSLFVAIATALAASALADGAATLEFNGTTCAEIWTPEPGADVENYTCTNFWQLWFLQIGSGLTDRGTNTTLTFHDHHAPCFFMSTPSTCNVLADVDCKWIPIRSQPDDFAAGIPTGFCVHASMESTHQISTTIDDNFVAPLRQLFNSTHKYPLPLAQGTCMAASPSKTDCEDAGTLLGCAYCEDIPSVYGLREASATPLKGMCQHRQIMNVGGLCEALKSPPKGAFEVGAAFSSTRSLGFALVVAIAAAAAGAVGLDL